MAMILKFRKYDYEKDLFFYYNVYYNVFFFLERLPPFLLYI